MLCGGFCVLAAIPLGGQDTGFSRIAAPKRLLATSAIWVRSHHGRPRPTASVRARPPNRQRLVYALLCRRNTRPAGRLQGDGCDHQVGDLGCWFSSSAADPLQ
jgi:hypothetical protein